MFSQGGESNGGSRLHSMILHRALKEVAGCSPLGAIGTLLIGDTAEMIGRYRGPISVEDSDDDADAADLQLISDSTTEKFKKFSDVQLEDEIEKYERLNNQKLNLADGGDKIATFLLNLKNEKGKRFRQRQRSLALTASKLRDEGNFVDFSTEPSQVGTIGDEQSRRGTGSTQPGISRGFGTCSTVKTDSLAAKSPLPSFSRCELLEDSEVIAPNNGKTIISSENISPSPSPERRASSLERATRMSSGEQAGPSCRESVTPNQNDQPGSCSVCKKSSHLYTLPGKDGLLCSVCRRKSKTPDPSVLIDSDLKTPATKGSGRHSRKRAREADVVGRTPDTAMEIDSSDEDEKASVASVSALKASGMETSRRNGLRSNFRRRMEGFKVAYPSRSDPDAVEILPSDIQRLDPMEFLNDTVIDFYIKYIQRDEFLGLEGRRRFHFFNSFFYKKLSEVVSSQGGADFSKLRKWTKGTNIFEKEYLFVPIHDKLHWSLAIICFPGSEKGSSCERCIIHLDSMPHGHESQRVFRLLRSYLVAEWKHSVEAGEHEGDECIHTLESLKADDIPYKKVPVPLQENESDCGLFLLHYIEKFVEHAPSTMKLSNLDGDWATLGVFGRDWFVPTEASSLRTSIQEQLQRLFEQEEREQLQGVSEQEKKEGMSSSANSEMCQVVIPLDPACN